MNDDKARAALVDEYLEDIEKVLKGIEDAVYYDTFSEKNAALTGAHQLLLRLICAGSPSQTPASFRRIYDKMQRGKVSEDDGTRRI